MFPQIRADVIEIVQHAIIGHTRDAHRAGQAACADDWMTALNHATVFRHPLAACTISRIPLEIAGVPRCRRR